MGDLVIPKFNEFCLLVEAKGKSQKEYKDYISKNKPLQWAALQHPEGDDVYDYVWGQMKRDFWMKPYKSWKKEQKNRLNSVKV